MEQTGKSPTIFIHGQESSSQGDKAVFFKKHFPDMIIPDFVGDVQRRMKKLNQILADKKGITMIGSSLGGLMAALFTFENHERVKKLILLAPALNLTEFIPYLSKRLTLPVFVFHGKYDEVIPLDSIQNIAEKVFTNLSFSIVDDDHRLSRTFRSIEWHKLIGND